MQPSPARLTSRWMLPEGGEAGAARLSIELGIHMPAARVLWQRGFLEAEQARRFLSPTLADLHDPFLLRGMDLAVTRILQAVQQREPILLYGDYDVDGTTSVVVLRKALEMAGADVSHFVPHRIKDGYGLHASTLVEAAQRGVRLVISVDTGIRASEAVREARRHNLDVVITDHHLPEGELPPAVAVVNPNQVDCPYPEKHLCGAGVTFKLIQALLPRFGWPEAKQQRVLDSFLKLVALATVADVVPLLGENRIIVRRGLEGFRDVRNVGLRALLQAAGFQDGDCPTAGQVAFRLAPRINAAGRMADANDVIELFRTDDAARASQLATQMNALNQERQGAEEQIVRAITEECLLVPVEDDQPALVFCGKGWHRGVVGIVASRLVERFHRPVFVLAEEDGLAQGSGRSIPSFHLLDALESMPDVFSKFGGHKQAAGLTLSAERVGEFRDRLLRFAGSCLTPDHLRPTIAADATLRLDELTEDAVDEVLALAPFGFGNPAPLFVVRQVTVAQEPAVFAEKHLRLRLQQNGVGVTAKAWRFAERKNEFHVGSQVDVVISLEEDSYSASRGYGRWGAVLKDVRPSIPKPF